MLIKLQHYAVNCGVFKKCIIAKLNENATLGTISVVVSCYALLALCMREWLHNYLLFNTATHPRHVLLCSQRTVAPREKVSHTLQADTSFFITFTQAQGEFSFDFKSIMTKVTRSIQVAKNYQNMQESVLGLKFEVQGQGWTVT